MTVIDNPAQYILKLETDNKQLRAELIKARADFDDAALALAAIVHQRKQLIDEHRRFKLQVEELLKEKKLIDAVSLEQ